MRKTATLMAGKFGSRDFGTTPYLGDALRLTGKSAPLVLYIGAASGDHRQFGAGISGVLEAAAKSVVRNMAGQVGRQIVRGVLGSILRSR